MDTTGATKTYFVGLLVGIAHFVSGIAVLATDRALSSTPLAGFHEVSLWLGLGDYSGWMLLAIGMMAVVGAIDWLWLHRKTRLYLFAPQQVLLLLQLWSTSEALIFSRYPDGYIPNGGGWFILADQVWALVLALSHSIWLAVILYGGERGDYNRNT